MSLTSKSPIRVAQQALAVGTNAWPAYAHRFSPQVYTQPQLFTCLVLKTFFKTDYCGIAQKLDDLTDLRRVVGLKSLVAALRSARRLFPLANRPGAD